MVPSAAVTAHAPPQHTATHRGRRGSSHIFARRTRAAVGADGPPARRAAPNEAAVE
jgi:hypothetical protein